MEINASKLTRREKLKIWLSRNKMTYGPIARALDVSDAAVSKLLFNDTVPTHRHKQLVEFGLPEDLLPEPKDIKPGPKNDLR